MISRHRSIAALAALLLCMTAADLAAQTKTVIVVRHAEKVDDSADPVLSREGIERAQSLAEALKDRSIGAIFTTQYQRTRLTAEPLAALIGVTPTVVSARGGNHAADVAAQVRASDAATILVVGHSNTVPAIVRELTGEDVGAIEDSEYGHMFVITATPAGETVVRTWYGRAAPAGK
jgi:broad specificity phosphatase PhoE